MKKKPSAKKRIPSAKEERNAIVAQLFKVSPTKGQLRKFEIVEAAIECIAIENFENVSFESIAKRAKASRPLLKHYFKSIEELFLIASQHVRTRFQQFALNAIVAAPNAREKFKAYIISTFDWVDTDPNHAAVLSYFLSRCAMDKRLRAINTEFAEIGRNRIEALLKLGNQEKAWSCKRSETSARQIQTLIGGALLAYGTDDQLRALTTFRNEVIQSCFDLIEHQ